MRLTYDLHHVFKRLEKYRKNIFMSSGAPHVERDRIPLEAVAEIPEPEPVPIDGEEHD
jgi:hypothetical protein